MDTPIIQPGDHVMLALPFPESWAEDVDHETILNQVKRVYPDVGFSAFLSHHPEPKVLFIYRR